MAEAGGQFRHMPDDLLGQSLEVWPRILERIDIAGPAFEQLVDSQIEWASHVVTAKPILEPDFHLLADLYGGRDGFIAQAGFLDFAWNVPDYCVHLADCAQFERLQRGRDPGTIPAPFQIG